jgi:hypothetical protein
VKKVLAELLKKLPSEVRKILLSKLPKKLLSEFMKKVLAICKFSRIKDDFVINMPFEYEHWQKLTPNRDWTKLAEEWSKINKSK